MSNGFVSSAGVSSVRLKLEKRWECTSPMVRGKAGGKRMQPTPKVSTYGRARTKGS